MHRYVYQIARVDLTRRESETYQVENAVFERYLGGKALGFYLAMCHRLHDVEPLGPKNRVFVLTGPGSGLLAGGGGTTLVTKSPATQTLTDPVVQGHLGLSIKRAGIDGIEIVGRSEDWVYLSIANDDIQFHDARSLQGMTCTDTSQSIKEQHPEIHNATVVSIGLAGENQVYYAATIVDGRAFGRGPSHALPLLRIGREAAAAQLDQILRATGRLC
jgi:aldehyde:ferredoxin oxidoreductase